MEKSRVVVTEGLRERSPFDPVSMKIPPRPHYVAFADVPLAGNPERSFVEATLLFLVPTCVQIIAANATLIPESEIEKTYYENLKESRNTLHMRKSFCFQRVTLFRFSFLATRFLGASF